MPSFAYTALAQNGKRTKGVCEAADLQAAAATLRATQMYILKIRPVTGPSATNLAMQFRRAATRLLNDVGRSVSNQDRIQFLRQMSLMLRSGLPLLQALEILASQCPKPRLAQAVRRVAQHIQNGESLSVALGRERSLLPPLSLKMIAVGETIGELDVIMERLASHAEHRTELRNSLLTSLTYPALLVLITAGVVVFLITKVMPTFVRVLANRNLSMPPTAQALVTVAGFLNAHGLELLFGLFGATVVVALLARIRPVRYWMDRSLLALPVIGDILTLAFVSHLGRTLGLLLKSGVPILDGLKIFGAGVGNRAFARHIEYAANEVLGGRALSHGLRARIVPPLLTEVVSVGEISGTLDTVLEDVARFYETRLQRKLKWLVSLFEPALILIVGGMVGFVYIAFFSVLYQVSAGVR
jgi:type IV pilus assembly protein PilC